MSPFMLGIYYRAQLTSVLSMLHRITGVVLSLIGVPLILLWLGAVAAGESSYAHLQEMSGHVIVQLLLLASLFSLSFHLFNGIRHLFWDIGKGLELKAVYASGWAVVVVSLTATLIVAGMLI